MPSKSKKSRNLFALQSPYRAPITPTVFENDILSSEVSKRRAQTFQATCNACCSESQDHRKNNSFILLILIWLAFDGRGSCVTTHSY